MPETNLFLSIGRGRNRGWTPPIFCNFYNLQGGGVRVSYISCTESPLRVYLIPKPLASCHCQRCIIHSLTPYLKMLILTLVQGINGKRVWTECHPGERPDTVVIKNLPTKWLSLDSNNPKPCERFLKDSFALYGTIRKVQLIILPLRVKRVHPPS